MPPELFQKSIEEAQRWAKQVTIGFFGEPTMNPNFNELIKSIPSKKDRKFTLALNTNWSLATKKNLEALNCFDQIRISIDASTKEMWEALCPGSDLLTKDGVKGSGRYETLIEKIKWFLKLSNRPPVLLIFVRQQANAEDEAIFRREWTQYLSKKDILLSKAMLTFGGVMLEPTMKRNTCRVADETRFVVAWDGRCTPCSLDVNIAMEAGNLYTQTLEEIVASPQWAKRIQGIRDRIGICANCFDGQNYGKTRTKGSNN